MIEENDIKTRVKKLAEEDGNWWWMIPSDPRYAEAMKYYRAKALLELELGV